MIRGIWTILNAHDKRLHFPKLENPFQATEIMTSAKNFGINAKFHSKNAISFTWSDNFRSNWVPF